MNGSIPDEHFMQLALEEADRALLTRDVPVGAVVVTADGTLLSRACNRREADGDPTAHAELLALRAASKGRGHWRLHDCTLYVTLEPCIMCAGALVNARVRRVVYGASDAKAGALQSLYRVGEDSRLNHQIECLGGILGAASQQRLQSFFRQLRAEGQK
jgi:tRNA(adenine34) deaminase